MEVVILCEKFGWTYQEYLKQPHWLLELYKSKSIIDKKNEQQ